MNRFRRGKWKNISLLISALVFISLFRFVVPVFVYAGSGSPPTVTISASATTYSPGDLPVTITWSSSDTTATCTGTNFSTGAGSPASGSTTVTPVTTTTYTATCTNSYGTGAQGVTVTYTAVTSASQTCTLPSGITPWQVTQSSYWKACVTSSTGKNWINSGTALPGNNNGAQLVVIGNSMYLIGVAKNGTYTGIYAASTSNPTSWVDTGKTLPNGYSLTSSNLAVIGNTMYLFGGWLGTPLSTGSSNVIYAASTSNPTNWIDTGRTLPVSISDANLAIVGSSVYLFGGSTGNTISGSSNVNTILSAPLTSPTTWTNTALTLPASISDAQVAILGNSLYLFGGFDGILSSTSTIYAASTSNPTSWTPVGKLPYGLALSQLSIMGNDMYLTGGFPTTSTLFIASTTNPTNWTNIASTTNPPLPFSSQAAVFGNHIYLFGGSFGLLSNLLTPYIFISGPLPTPPTISGPSVGVTGTPYTYTFSGGTQVGATTTFAYTGADQTYVVPQSVTSIQVQLSGAGGHSNAAGNAVGAAGGSTTGTIAVTPGQVLTVVVGQSAAGTSASYGGGAVGGGANNNAAGSGGGRSAIRSGAVELMTAGGGGGGGWYTDDPGGSGGGSSGNAGGGVSFGAVGGGGGTASVGGTGGGSGAANQIGATGTAFAGGAGASLGGGGGGGGYYGGGGGGSTSANGYLGGGGGGSGYCGGAGVTNCTTTTGAGSAASANGIATMYAQAPIRYGIDWLGNGVTTEYDPVSGYISSGGSQITTHTWNTPGTYIIGAVTQDSLGFRSATTTYTVTIYQAPTALLSAATTSYRQGDPADVLTWSSVAASSCAGTGFSTGNATSGTASVTPTATTTYTVVCTGGGGSATSSVTVNYRPDLPPSIPTISGATNITQNQSNTYTFTATDPEGDSLHYGVDWTGSGSVMQWLPATSSYVLSGVSATSSYAQSGTGTISLKALAQDSRGQSSGWGTLTLSVAPSCTPTAVCSGGNVINSCTGATMQTCGYGCNNGACYVPSPAFATSTYNGSALTGHLQLRPSLIRKNSSAHVFWNVSNASSCAVTSSATTTDSWTGFAAPTGGATTSAITGLTTYTLSCSALPGATSTGVYEQQSVNVAPAFREK